MAKLSLLSLCLVACLVEICQAQCDAYEGDPLIMQCTFRPSGNITTFSELIWKGNFLAGAKVISTCKISGVCTNNFAPTLIATITNNTSTLTFVKVSRSGPFNTSAQVSCLWSPLPSAITVCSSLTVIAKPQNLSCVLESVNATTKKVNCSAERVFPANLICQQFISTDNVSLTNYNGSELTYTKSSMNETPEYFSWTCQVLLSDRFFIGTNYYKVRIYLWPPYYSKKYYVDTTFVLTTGFVLEDTTQNNTNLGQGNNTVSLGVAIGLGVAAAIFAIIAVILAILMIVFWLRGRKKQPSPRVVKPSSTQPTPQVVKPSSTQPSPHVVKPSSTLQEGYNSVESSQVDPEEHNYEEVNTANVTSAGSNQKQRVQSSYLNWRVNKSKAASGGNKEAQQQIDPDESSLYVNLGELKTVVAGRKGD